MGIKSNKCVEGSKQKRSWVPNKKEVGFHDNWEYSVKQVAMGQISMLKI